MAESSVNSQNGPLVRTPIEKPVETLVGASKSTPVEDVVTGGTDPTPSEIIGLERPPYIVDLMKALPAYKTFDVKDRMELIDSFIREDNKDTRKDYESRFNEILKQIKETGDVYKDIDQLYEYVKIQNKIKDLIREQKEFEAKDPEEMSSDQLRRFFKQKERDVNK